MMMKHDTRSRPVAAQPRAEVAPARRGLGDVNVDVFALEHGSQKRDPGALVAGRIGRVDLQVLPQPVNGLVAEGRPVGDQYDVTPTNTSSAPVDTPSSPSATVRVLVTRGTLFWPPSLPRERSHA